MIVGKVKRMTKSFIRIYILNLFNTHHEFISEAEILINFLTQSPLNVIVPLLIIIGSLVSSFIIIYKTVRNEVPTKYFLSWTPTFLGFIFVIVLALLNIFNGTWLHQQLALIFEEIQEHYRATEKLRRKILNQKKILNAALFFDILCSIACAIILTPWQNTIEDEAFYFAIYSMNQIGFDNIVFTFLLSLTFFYICFICISGVWAIVALTLVVKYEIMILIDDLQRIKSLNQLRLKNDPFYQAQIKRHLLFCIFHYQKIRMCRRIVCCGLKMTLFLIQFLGTLFFIGCIVFIVENALPARNLQAAIMAIYGLKIYLLLPYVAHSLANEHDKLYDTLQSIPLYLWNKENLYFMEIFKIMSLEDFVIEGYLARLDIKVLIRIFKGVYSAVLFFISLHK